MGKFQVRRAASGHDGLRGGFSLVEVTILALLLLVAVGGLSGAVLSSLKLARATEESSLADEAARALAARIQAQPFDQIFRLFNEDPNDEVPPGSGPGPAFDVRGLTARRGDPDGRVGRIVFPSVELLGGGRALREDVIDPRLGMAAGRDLNGDGDLLDELSSGYVLLPMRVIVEWTGAGGNRSYELDLVLVP